jgi:O-acetyl-ADP-ribose deacetylase (regulator of RNase III)
MEFWGNKPCDSPISSGAADLQSPERMDLMERKLAEGKISQEEYNCLVQKEQRGQTLDTEVSGPRIVVVLADIEKFADASVVVNPITGSCAPRNNCSSNIFEGGGKHLLAECKRAFASWEFRSDEEGGSLPSGSCAMTSGFSLQASRVAHIVTPRLNCQYRSATEHAVAACYTAVMNMVSDSGFESIAFPQLWSNKIPADAMLAYTHVALNTISSLLTPSTRRVYLCTRSVAYRDLLEGLVGEYLPTEPRLNTSEETLHGDRDIRISALGRVIDDSTPQPLSKPPKAPLLSVWIDSLAVKKANGETFTAYSVKVMIGSRRKPFYLQRRYSEFRLLRSELMACCKKGDRLRNHIKNLPFPPRVLVGGRDAAVVRKRSDKLEQFIQSLVCMQANDPCCRSIGCHIELKSAMLHVLHEFLGADAASIAGRVHEEQRLKQQKLNTNPVLGEITNTASRAPRNEITKSARLHLRAKVSKPEKNEEGNRFITNAQL